jgi:hypothetical protein
VAESELIVGRQRQHVKLSLWLGLIRGMMELPAVMQDKISFFIKSYSFAGSARYLFLSKIYEK